MKRLANLLRGALCSGSFLACHPDLNAPIDATKDAKGMFSKLPCGKTFDKPPLDADTRAIAGNSISQDTLRPMELNCVKP
jgi:hypothetical protein